VIYKAGIVISIPAFISEIILLVGMSASEVLAVGIIAKYFLVILHVISFLPNKTHTKKHTLIHTLETPIT